MEDVVKARIDKETKKELMILVKTKGKTLSEVIRTALEEYAKKNRKKRLLTQSIYYTKKILQKHLKHLSKNFT